MRPIKKAAYKRIYAMNAFFGALLALGGFIYKLVGGKLNYFFAGTFLLCFTLAIYWYFSYKKIARKILTDEDGNVKPTYV